ncbi:MAG: DUF3800 domain-containing protein [Anaerolineae bacterium]|nr:DUF3800 domain-containing protein [Anaerolineae bacterium]
MTTKLYCYVDESGQDTQGELFIVSVVVTSEERDRVAELCERIEQESGKGRVKWIKTEYPKRVEYIRLVLMEPAFEGKLLFAVYRNGRDYVSLTVLTIAHAILACKKTAYKATVFIDGLPRSQERWMGGELRRQRIQVRKVRGVRKEETDALVRLADALCGLVRAALEGQDAMRYLFEQGKSNGVLKELI